MRPRFLIPGLFFVVFIGGGFPIYYYTVFEPALFNQLVDSTEQDSIRIARHFAQEIFSEDSGADKKQIALQFANIEQHKQDLGLWKLKFFSPTGEVLYSSAGEEVGEINTKSYFRDTIAKGISFSKLVVKDGLSMENQAVSVDVVETYVPIMRQGKFFGAFELYYDVTSRKEAMTELHKRSVYLFSFMSILMFVLSTFLGFRIKRSADEQMLIEKEIQDQAALLEATLGDVPVPIFYKDTKGVYRGCNRAFEECCGRPKNEIIGKTVYDLAPKGFADICYRTDQVLFQGGGEQVYEADLDDDGQHRNILMHKAAFKTVENNISGLVGSITDITKQKQIEQVILEDRAFLQEIIDGAIDPLLVIAPDYEVLLMNKAAQDYLPGGPVEGKRYRCHQVSHQCDSPCGGEDHPCPLREVCRTGKRAVAIHQHVLASGDVRTLELEATPLWNQDGTLRAVVESSRDITERVKFEDQLRNNEERMRHMAYHDLLTGLPNRLLFQDRLQQLVGKGQRSRQPFALLFLDIDRFKEVNDTLGHDAGDTLLKAVAQRLLLSVRDTDTVARFGGDEFVIILEQFKELQNITLVAQKILSNLQPTIVLKDTPFHVSISIGIAMYPDDAVDSEELIKCADMAMYRAKEQGMDSYQFYISD